MSTVVSSNPDSSHASPTRAQASRSHSTRSRPPPATPTSPQRASSISSHHSRQTSNTRPIQELLPQKDYEASNIPDLSKRNASRDRPPTTRGSEASRPHRRGSARSNHGAPPDMPATAAAVNSGAGPASHTAVDPPPASAKHSRSRTTVPTQSGKWILGKTIGAGSMGKVKLARKEDGSEQVSPRPHGHWIPTLQL